jgi:hypothetical protein
MTTHTPSVEQLNAHETDRAEGGLFLCESDLIGALILSHYPASYNAQAIPEAPAALLNLNGRLAVAAL